MPYWPGELPAVSLGQKPRLPVFDCLKDPPFSQLLIHNFLLYLFPFLDGLAKRKLLWIKLLWFKSFKLLWEKRLQHLGLCSKLVGVPCRHSYFSNLKLKL